MDSRFYGFRINRLFSFQAGLNFLRSRFEKKNKKQKTSVDILFAELKLDFLKTENWFIYVEGNSGECLFTIGIWRTQSYSKN